MSETDASLSSLAARLRQPGPDYPAGRFAGRGIVIAAGGASLFTNAWVLVSILRHTLHCTLPVEVWHFGPGEMSPHMAALLREQGVTLVDAVPRIAAAGASIRDGWQLKAFCLCHSAFEEVLLLDADQVPVTDPAALFDWPQYRDSGAVFWPDIVVLRRELALWGEMGLTPPEPPLALETGQLLVDKRRHWRALSVALALNEAAHLLYRVIYGDKDTFLLAWMLAEERFSVVPHQPFRGDRCLFQRDFDGNTLFQHRTNGKWLYDGVQFASENFRLIDACEAALADLRRRWNGRVFHAPDRSPAARDAEADLIATRAFRLEVAGDDPVDLELLAHGEFGAGRSAIQQNWWCEEEAGTLRLVISDGHQPGFRLVRGEAGRWSGTLPFPGARAAILAPAAPANSPVAGAGGVADLLLAALGPDPAAWPAGPELLARLAHAEPGIAARLAVLARDAGPAGEVLTALLDGLRERVRTQPVDMHSDLLRTSYRPVVGDG